VRTPGGEVLLDAGGRLPGRGAYLCADGSCWATALKKRSIERALGVELSPELRARLLEHPTEQPAIQGDAIGP
jgi:predicted RNA-binding protein YlxR (DUF448 family)